MQLIYKQDVNGEYAKLNKHIKRLESLTGYGDAAVTYDLSQAHTHRLVLFQLLINRVKHLPGFEAGWNSPATGAIVPEGYIVYWIRTPNDYLVFECGKVENHRLLDDEAVIAPRLRAKDSDGHETAFAVIAVELETGVVT